MDFGADELVGYTTVAAQQNTGYDVDFGVDQNDGYAQVGANLDTGPGYGAPGGTQGGYATFAVTAQQHSGHDIDHLGAGMGGWWPCAM